MGKRKNQPLIDTDSTNESDLDSVIIKLNDKSN